MRFAIVAGKTPADVRLLLMRAAFEKLRGFFHGCAYEPALDAAPQDVLPVYLRAIDHAFDRLFAKLRHAFSNELENG